MVAVTGLDTFTERAVLETCWLDWLELAGWEEGKVGGEISLLVVSTLFVVALELFDIR